MLKQRVLLIGTDADLGRSIIDELLELAAFVPSIAMGPSGSRLMERGVKVYAAGIDDPLETLVMALSGVDVVISTGLHCIQGQINLVNAAAIAGVKRFVPCLYSDFRFQLTNKLG
ncbi:MAG: hypothetical protein M1834_007944 [Cirrosporium novae-zelandiae]|nr:MAG: hypothetical protein M1834_007944 [Cirrosporium novae-zelandiae]